MHLLTQIGINPNIDRNELLIAFNESFQQQNDIDRTLREMLSINNDIVENIREFLIFGIKTNSFYLLFYDDTSSIQCQIEIHSEDATFSYHLSGLFNMLNVLEQRMKQSNFTSSKFLPLRIFDGRGKTTGIVISKSNLWKYFSNELKNNGFYEILAMIGVYLIFRVVKSQALIDNLLPTLAVAVILIIIKFVVMLISKKEFVTIKGVSNE